MRPRCVDGVALVTGGGSGIGRAVALAFSQAGASVAVADFDARGARQTRKMIEAVGGKAISMAADVADVVLWLCSEQASFMVGAAIAVDGGYTVV